MKLSQSSRALFGGIVWVLVGLSLAVRGTLPFGVNAFKSDATWAAIALVLGLVLGAAKGYFVLKKTSVRNIARIASRPAPEPFWQISPPYLALLIPLMIGFGILLRKYVGESHPQIVFGTYVGIGAALMASSPPFFQAARRFKAEAAKNA